jgi:hypothetical protein
MLTTFTLSPTLNLAGTLLGILLVALSPDSRAEAIPSPATMVAVQPADPDASYKTVDMKELVAKSRTTIPGQRAIFAPTPIKFKARLFALPSPQKAEYLSMALSMMKVSSPPKVSQRIGIDYGGEKPLATYIEEGAATRLAANAKIGQALTFYAFHVYNGNSGPALVVTAFAD